MARIISYHEQLGNYIFILHEVRLGIVDMETFITDVIDIRHITSMGIYAEEDRTVFYVRYKNVNECRKVEEDTIVCINNPGFAERAEEVKSWIEENIREERY